MIVTERTPVRGALPLALGIPTSKFTSPLKYPQQMSLHSLQIENPHWNAPQITIKLTHYSSNIRRKFIFVHPVKSIFFF